jgi:hypothetical protein
MIQSNLSVRTLRTTDEICQISELWHSWQHHPNSALEFYLMILRARPAILRPHVLVVYRNGQPVTMLVGRVEDQRMDLKLGYASPWKPWARALVLIYGGLLGESSTETCQALIRSILESLREGEADFAFFNFLHKDCSLLKWSRTLPGMLSRDLFTGTQPHRSMHLPRTAEELYNGLPSKQRKNQRWQAKKFERAFPEKLKIRCFHEPAALDEMFADVEVVAKKTYQRGLGVGFVDNPEMRERMSLAAKSGWLRAYVLYIAENPCAFWIGSAVDDAFYSSYLGYDPAYMQYSPGMYLIMKVLEQFCNGDNSQRLQTVDFGLGDAQYKQVLGDISWEETSTYIFAPSLKGYALNLLRAPIVSLDGFAKKVLDGTKVLLKIKRVWRKHARA